MMSQNNYQLLDKNNKYDRQLRLWGDHGQTALEMAQVCLINATAVGTEILKNLILPGVGTFKIIDGARVVGRDVGNNFFLTADSVGRKRGEVATKLLLELNADVTGEFLDDTIENVLDNNPSYLKQFTAVIATDLLEVTKLRLDKLLSEYDVPLLICRAFGFIGYMRLVVSEHCIIESHPDNAFEDLRIDRPFLSLIEHVNSIDMKNMSKKDHGHLPYLIILLKCAQEWKQQFITELLPKNYKEKNQFRQLIRKHILLKENGVPEDEENFEEAINAVNVALATTKIPDEIEKLFADDKVSNLNADNAKPFWICVAALKQFVENEGDGSLPVRGSIPDMFADSDSYIKLQNIYHKKAMLDTNAVYHYVLEILGKLDKPSDFISKTYVELVCKNASFLRVIQCRPLMHEHDSKMTREENIKNHLSTDAMGSEMVWYVMLRAVDKFYAFHHRYPGCQRDEDAELDFPLLKQFVLDLLKELQIFMPATGVDMVGDEYIQEMCRYGAAELHSIAATVGGMGAQEVIKVITKQFVPFNNTYIYNGITGSSATFEM